MLSFVSAVDYKPDYPFAPTDVIFSEVQGNIDCRNTGDWAAYKQQSYTTKESNPLSSGWSDSYLSCPANVGTQGCEYRIRLSCPTGIFAGSDPYISNDGGISYRIVRNGEVIKMSAGENRNLRITCANKDPASSYGEDEPASLTIDLREAERKLYVEASGYTASGFLPGSSQCKLVSTDADTLKKLQKSNNNALSGVENIRFGESRNIIVGWREVPSFGNVNPLGQYNGRDIIYKPFDGIYEVNKVGTVGGRTYWTQGSKLKSYSSQNSLCGGETGECAGGFSCEEYECKAEPEMCTEGQCNFYQRGSVISRDVPVEQGGKFYLETKTCQQNGCIQTEREEVSCTPNYCDRQSGGDAICDYNNGCVDISVLQAPPANTCSAPGGKWETQSCAQGTVCCYEDESDPFLGICRTSCDPNFQISSTGQQTQCEANGGKWIERTTEPTLWEEVRSFGFAEATTTGQCLTPHISILAVLISVVGIGLIVFAIMKGQVLGIVFGSLIALVGIIWSLLAGAGYV